MALRLLSEEHGGASMQTEPVWHGDAGAGGIRHGIRGPFGGGQEFN
jgi:hypothetical protein